MYYIQKRKSVNSQWHTLKDRKGRKLGSHTIPNIKPLLEKYESMFPGHDFRIVDNTTGDFVTL